MGGMRVMTSRTASGKWPGKWLAVSPKDGSLYWGGDRNTSTGREPYRQPFLHCFDGDGNWHVSAGARIGMGMDFSGMKGANSLASIMILNAESKKTYVVNVRAAVEKP